MASKKKMKLFYTYDNGPKTKLLVDPEIEWEDLYALIARKVGSTVSAIRIHYDEGDESWAVLTSDEFPLDELTQLRVEKVRMC